MVYIDKKDFNIYQSVSDVRIQAPLFEVDEFIAPIISLLNKKGYVTKYCCSGHMVKVCHGDSTTIKILNDNYKVSFSEPNNSCYITFGDRNQFKDVKEFPNKSEIEYSDYNEEQRLILSIKYKETDSIKERFTEIFSTMLELYEWAESLPSL